MSRFLVHVISTIVKVRFQSPGTSSRYTGTFQAISTIVREERITGLYKGIVSPVISCAPLNGLVFASYRFFMKSQLTSENDKPTLYQIALSGAGTGVVGSLISTPVELLKIRQQGMLTQISIGTLLLQIMRTQGIRGLYRGITATALRDLGYGTYFFTYEATCRLFSRPIPPPQPSIHHSASDLIETIDSDFQTVPVPALLLAGALAGIAGWMTTFPLDVVKTRIQGTSINNSKQSFGMGITIDTIISSWKSEGPRVFWAGLSPTLIRAIPVNMVTFGAFEAVIHVLS